MAAALLAAIGVAATACGSESKRSPRDALLVEQSSERAFLVDPDSGRETELAPRRGWKTQAVTWTPDGEQIVLLRVAPGDRRSLWIADATGRRLRRLTHPRNRGYGGDGGLAFSPDGTQLAFGRETARSSRIGVVRLDGGHERMVGRGRADVMAWTRDGHGLCVQYGHWPDIRSRVLRLSPGAVHPQTCRRSAWRRDDASLFVRGDRHGGTQIWLRNARGREWKLTNDLPLDPVARVLNHSPEWSPDGSRVAFLSARGRENDLYVIDADGTHERRLTWDRGAMTPSWSADGKSVAFLGDYPQALFVVPVTGGPPRRVLRTHDEIETASWQPPASPRQLAPLRPVHRHARRLRVLPAYLPRGHVRVVEPHLYGYQAEPILVDLSPDGRFVSYISVREPEGAYGLGVYDLARGRRRILEPARAGTQSYQVGGGFFSPDGRWILLRRRNELRIVSPVTGEQRKLVGDSSRAGGTWLRDGRVAYTTVGRRLVFVSLGGARQSQPFRVPNPPRRDDLDDGYAVSPDGTRVVYVRDCALWMRNLATRRTTRVVGRAEFGFAPDARSWSPDGAKFVASNVSWNDASCREFFAYPPSENRLFDRDGRRIGIVSGGGTTWSRDGRWLAVFDGQHGTNVGGLQPLDVVSFPSRRVTSLFVGGNAGPAFIGPGDRILYSHYAHPEVFGPPLETGVGAHPELWLGRLVDPARQPTSRPSSSK